MTLPFLATLVGLGFAGAFVAGLLGVGGAVVMIPLLLYGPPALRVGQLDVHAVAGVTMAQVFVAAVSGVLGHWRRGTLHPELTRVGGVAMAGGSALGAVASRVIGETWLLLVFALMATAAVVLLVIPVELIEPPAEVAAVPFSRVRAAVVAGGVGAAAGLVGAGGAFLLVPLLLVVVRVPLRTAIAASLGMTALAATAGFAGKVLTGQVPPLPALAVALGAIPGAQVGVAVGGRLAGARLRQLLVLLVALTAVRLWWDVFRR